MIDGHATCRAARPRRRRGGPRPAFLCVAIAAVLCSWMIPIAANSAAAVDGPGSVTAAAPTDGGGADAGFDRNLLSGAGQSTADISRFEHGNPVSSGTYNTDVYLNASWVGRSNVRFAAASADASATPCVGRQLLDQLGLHPDKLSAELANQLKDPTACVAIGSVIPDATMTFDMGDLRLDTSVPQAYLGQTPRGYVSPEYWDAGVPAALLNYNFNNYHTSSQGLSQTSAYLGLNAGLNIGPWHLRQDSALNWQSASASVPSRRQWQNIDTYVQRDLPSLRAQLTVGDSFTDGQVFDSYGLRGIQLASDDRMLPDSLRGYAPVVRGVAETNARVTVRQNGVQIYQTTVAPGPFTINDLYPTGYGGSLDVTVTEADGRVRAFSVPYASVVQLLRPGITRFDIAAGQLRNQSIEHQPAVAQATVQHGFNNLLTGYTGIAGSQGYDALLLGSALNTRYGALAFDITQARARIPGFVTQSGHSVRLSYSKTLPETDTTLSVAAYRYSSSGYLSLSDAAVARDYARRGANAFDYVPPVASQTIDGIPLSSALTAAQQSALYGGSFDNVTLSGTGLQRQRNNFSLSISQRFGAHGGSFYANTSASNYWNRTGTDTQFQVGYNNAFHRISYSISATRTRDPLGQYDNEYLASFSVPLGDSAHAPTFSLNMTRNQNGGTQDQAMINGSAGADNEFNYGATAAHDSTGASNSGSLNGGYRSPFAVFNVSAGSGSGYSQDSLSVSGAVVAHPGGVTFGQPMGDTVGIVYAPGADGARLTNAAGARIDRFGYALVPFLSPYGLNTVGIDPKGLPLDVQLDATSAQVAPYAGAVVMLKFKTENGRTILVRAHLDNGQALPFAAEVFNEKGVSLGMVGQAGQVLLRGVDEAGKLTAHWQDDSGTNQTCSFAYKLAPRAKDKHPTAYESINATCTQPIVAVANRSGT